MPVMLLSLDAFLLSLKKFTGGRMFLIHATFPMMNCKMLMEMFALEKHRSRLLD